MRTHMRTHYWDLGPLSGMVLTRWSRAAVLELGFHVTRGFACTTVQVGPVRVYLDIAWVGFS